MSYPPTPGLNCDKLRDVNPRRATKGYATRELWECWLANADGTVNESGVIDADTIIDDPLLPAMGSPHPKFPNAIVIDKMVTQVVANWSVIVQVIYQGWGLYHGGPTAQIESYGQEFPLELPVWRRLQSSSEDPSGPPTTYTRYVRDHNVFWQRTTVFRTETVYLSGNQADSIQGIVTTNAGCWYNFRDGPSMLLSGKTRVLFDGTSRTVALYKFYTWGAVPEIPAGSAFGNDVLIPALPALCVYSDYENPLDQSLPPIITPVPFLAAAPQGAQLPGRP